MCLQPWRSTTNWTNLSYQIPQKEILKMKKIPYKKLIANYFMSDPCMEHWVITKRIFKYL
jgi:hypothetical protein